MTWTISIFIISLLIGLYVYKVVREKKIFWSLIAISVTNFLVGVLFSISNSALLGLIIFIIPSVFVLVAYYRHLTSKVH